MPTALKTTRAVGYLRVSTLRQTGERHSSLDTQESHFHNYCQQHIFNEAGLFTDVISGRRDDRKEYRRMLDFVSQGGADVIVVQFLDRFGRNPKEILRRYWELQDQGVSVVATDEDIGEEIILLVKAGVAGAESRRTSERVRTNMSRAVSKGVHVGRPPYGLRYVKDVHDNNVEVRWEPDPVEAPILREMYRLAVEENRGYKTIADVLTERGYRARGGHPFASYTIEQILTNPAIMGTLTYGRKPRKGNPKSEIVEVPDFFPAILSKEEWRLLQERQEIRREISRGRAHSSEYLLSGTAKCGHCGGPMTGKAGSSYRGKRYRNYYCSSAVRGRGLCSVYNGHAAEKLEKNILEYLNQFTDPEKMRQHVATNEIKDTVRYEAELKGIEKRLAELETQFLTQLDALLKRQVLTEQEFAKANESARAEKAALEARKEELVSSLKQERATQELVERLPQDIKSYIETFQTLDFRRRKAQFQTILKAVYVFNDGRIELEFRGQNNKQ
jgi:site-specific DNA recombinase